MSDDLDIRRWKWSDKLLMWGIGLMCFLNLVIGILTLGPDLLHW